ncbi:quinone oxidoreductase [Mycobacterium sp. 1465703.0]|uniref:quinone oxidoreductase family protein n=1 Tax=Mycobacterium sp. 1465703.0 TaxID=1834078 RepID=UPI0008022CCB|nr:quinone oxidoreductase [Mycobacterium sp. 1465703.0]OBJ08860.1 hypothetical protein A5625_14245 [Mycobacterium sp. 1465703.0]
MRAVVVKEFGGPDVLAVVDQPDPHPGPSDLVVRVQAAGVNFRDVMVRRGAYPSMPPPPLRLGTEGAGVVVEIGHDVTEFSVGDRVAWPNTDGSYSEFAVVPAAQAVHVPPAVETTDGAAVLAQGLTAHYLATSVWGPISPGDSALVFSAAGGVGRLLTQIITAHGGRVLGVVSDEAKVEHARASGAEDVVVGYDGIAIAARNFTHGRGVDVVFNGVGGPQFRSSLDCVRRRGMVVLYGASGGQTPLVDVHELADAGSIFLTRPRLADFVATRAELTKRADEVFSWLTEGSIKLHLSASYSLANAAAAHRALESRSTTGKLVLVP